MANDENNTTNELISRVGWEGVEEGWEGSGVLNRWVSE